VLMYAYFAGRVHPGSAWGSFARGMGREFQG
jgi:hypothetical protein